jgi:hypothetical protein
MGPSTATLAETAAFPAHWTPRPAPAPTAAQEGLPNSLGPHVAMHAPVRRKVCAQALLCLHAHVVHAVDTALAVCVLRCGWASVRPSQTLLILVPLPAALRSPGESRLLRMRTARQAMGLATPPSRPRLLNDPHCALPPPRPTLSSPRPSRVRALRGAASCEPPLKKKKWGWSCSER